jgi:hypothetical protein
MSADIILFRLRRFLLVLAYFLFAGTLVELVFTGHTEEPAQFIPFILCGLGFLAAGAALIRPRRKTLLVLRACMSLVALGSLFGLYMHVTSNAEFYLEIYPQAAFLETVAAALGGANPLVAPGILALAAIIAGAATYAHPALNVAARNQVDRPSGPRLSKEETQWNTTISN